MDLAKDLSKLPTLSLDDVKRAFKMRLIAGEVLVNQYAKFNSLRHTLIIKNPEYERHLGTKSKTIRMFVNIFIEYPNIVMELAEKLDRRKNE